MVQMLEQEPILNQELAIVFQDQYVGFPGILGHLNNFLMGSQTANCTIRMCNSIDNLQVQAGVQFMVLLYEFHPIRSMRKMDYVSVHYLNGSDSSRPFGVLCLVLLRGVGPLGCL